MATDGWQDVTEEQARKMGRGARMPAKAPAETVEARSVSGQARGRSKFGAVKTALDGVTFDSKREANRYSQLKSMESAGLISGLWLQPRYPVCVPAKDGSSMFVCDYIADFRYTQAGAAVIEDVKSPATRTAVYKLKKRLVEALYGITISEV